MHWWPDAYVYANLKDQRVDPMTLNGIVHGKVIDLNQETGLPDGQEVSVTLQPVAPGTRPAPMRAGRELPRWQGQDLGKLTRAETYGDSL